MTGRGELHRELAPGDTRVVLSLTFDDGRDSQLDVALPLLDGYGIQATFFVLPVSLRRRRDGWRTVSERGHEIGNHTVTHPCSANFGFSIDNALEDYTVDRMVAEIDDASKQIESLTGVRPVTFAYPCGQSFLGRGESRSSYAPVVARRFLAGRGYGSETSNDLERCDLAHLDAFAIDGMGAEQIVELIEDSGDGRWIILAGHDVGDGGPQTVLVDALEAVCRRAGRPDVWIAPMREVAACLR